MKIPSKLIKDYLEQKFPENKRSSQEFLVNSIFGDDHKYHMSINLDTGLWQDFKSGEKGNFEQLISHVEGIPFENARHWLRRKLLDSPECLFDVSAESAKNIPISGRGVEGEFRDGEFQVFSKKDTNHTSILTRLAARFVRDRKLPGKFMVCKKGRYWGRIIIPYIKNGVPFYFQARSLNGASPKYLNPSRATHGLKSSDILYPFNTKLPYVYVTEGPLDALALQANGVNATSTQGSHMSFMQARELTTSKRFVILAFDNDEAGQAGIDYANALLLKLNHRGIGICQPPKEYKDWNEFHIASHPEEVELYLQDNTKRYNWEFKFNVQLDS